MKLHLHFFTQLIKFINLFFFFINFFNLLPISLSDVRSYKICNPNYTHYCQDMTPHSHSASNATRTLVETVIATTPLNSAPDTSIGTIYILPAPNAAAATPPPRSSPQKEIPTSPSPRSAPTEAPFPPDYGRSRIVLPIIVAAIVGMVATIAVILYCLRRMISSEKLFFWKKKTKNSQSVEEFLKNHEALVPKRFKYSEIKKMTNSFKDKLGQGAFGGVFRGKLHDDERIVAVKLLRESKDNGEEFINEVASISRTSHVNIVTLIGFCIEDSKRALIYEFMSNGSLEKFIYDDANVNPLQKQPQQLEWGTLYKIAIGIARGLEYLHRGCNTRILHFDIKPHNILLDHDFCPKISDFGLSKLCLKKESIVSMIGARGTPGYIAPELIYRNFGGVSHKSDVYSYGMMVLEMVGGRRNIDARVENISEIYFPHWIHKRLDTCGDLRLRGVATTEDEEIARKMILVGLWCIQMDPSNRPAMNIVLDMLEGSLDALRIPPMQIFTSISRSQPATSTTSSAS